MKKNRKAAALIAASVILSGVLCGCADAQKDGVKALENGDYKEAETQFLELARSGEDEDAAEGYRGLGMTYYETEDYQGALDAFAQALEHGAQQSVQMYNLMGICAMQTGDYPSALEYLQSGLALTSTSEGKEETDPGLIQEMKYNEVICYEQQADWENAKQKAAAYVEAYPDDEAMQKEAEFLETR